MKEEISFSDFQKVDMRTGTVLSAEKNKKARNPAYVMDIDFGELGIKKSSAQITENYNTEDLEGRQVIAIVNFAPKNIVGVRSEVLVLGVLSGRKGVVLLEPGQQVENGMAIG